MSTIFPKSKLSDLKTPKAIYPFFAPTLVAYMRGVFLSSIIFKCHENLTLSTTYTFKTLVVTPTRIFPSRYLCEFSKKNLGQLEEFGVFYIL